MDCDKLPTKTTISEMRIEGRALAKMQLTEAFTSCSNNTLHSDGTTKFGHKFQCYQVTTQDSSLSLGLEVRNQNNSHNLFNNTCPIIIMQEITSGTAETMLAVLQDILQELAEGVQRTGLSNEVGTIVANIKNTMSDRAAAQKSFNTLLATYRSDILPSVVSNWKSLSNDEQLTISQMHNFYCGMHLVVNMAEHTYESLKLVERNFESETTHAFCTDEPGTVRLVRTACKAFERRGDEKSGCPIQFQAYLKRKGIPIKKLIHFRGNRFNIIFANGARTYYLHQHITSFLNSWGTPNRLLRAVFEDISNTVYVAGIKALGLIDKFITGPLWRILESGIHALDLPQHYTKLKNFFESCTDKTIATFVTGENTPFSSKYVKKDEVWLALVSPSEHDTVTRQMLLCIFQSLALLLDRVLADYHPVMQAETEKKEEMRAQTSSVIPTNTISERDFAMFDRLLREKPHASTLALEAHILFANNKTSEWMMKKSEEERCKIMEEARKNAPQHRKRYQQRLSVIEKVNIEQQHKKEMEREESEKRQLQAKEKITTDIIDHGLWQSEKQLDDTHDNIKSETRKREAIKAQLRFRKTVLQQTAQDDSIYKFSSKERGQFTSKTIF